MIPPSFPNNLFIHFPTMTNMSTTPSPSPTPPKPRILTQVLALDHTLTHTIHTLTHPIIPTSILKLLELTGDGRLWFPLTLSLLLTPLSLPLYSLTLSLFLGLITDIALIGLIKHLVRRPRPAHNSHPMGAHLPVDKWSFPSGHSSRALFVAALLHFSVVGRDPIVVSCWVVAGVWVWSLATSVSRVLLGRHYLLDVSVGGVVGVVNALFVYRFLRF